MLNSCRSLSNLLRNPKVPTFYSAIQSHQPLNPQTQKSHISRAQNPYFFDQKSSSPFHKTKHPVAQEKGVNSVCRALLQTGTLPPTARTALRQRGAPWCTALVQSFGCGWAGKPLVMSTWYWRALLNAYLRVSLWASD